MPYVVGMRGVDVTKPLANYQIAESSKEDTEPASRHRCPLVLPSLFAWLRITS